MTVTSSRMAWKVSMLINQGSCELKDQEMKLMRKISMSNTKAVFKQTIMAMAKDQVLNFQKLPSKDNITHCICWLACHMMNYFVFFSLSRILRCSAYETPTRLPYISVENKTNTWILNAWYMVGNSWHLFDAKHNQTSHEWNLRPTSNESIRSAQYETRSTHA